MVYSGFICVGYSRPTETGADRGKIHEAGRWEKWEWPCCVCQQFPLQLRWCPACTFPRFCTTGVQKLMPSDFYCAPKLLRDLLRKFFSCLVSSTESGLNPKEGTLHKKDGEKLGNLKSWFAVCPDLFGDWLVFDRHHIGNQTKHQTTEEDLSWDGPSTSWQTPADALVSMVHEVDTQGKQKWSGACIEGQKRLMKPSKPGCEIMWKKRSSDVLHLTDLIPLISFPSLKSHGNEVKGGKKVWKKVVTMQKFQNFNTKQPLNVLRAVD